MTGPCTESALVPVKSGLSLEAGSELAKVLNSGLATLHETPGLQRTYYGFEHENPTNLHLYNEWSKLEDHEAFMKSECVCSSTPSLIMSFSLASTSSR